MADTKLSAETNHVTTFNGDERIRVCDDPGGVPATGYSTFGDLFPGYIGDNGAKLLYVGAAAYSVLPGSANVNGTILTWASNIARSGLSLSANTLYYIYLYSSSGTPAVQESIIVPVWDSALNYWKKTGDATRRLIGYIVADAGSSIMPFVNSVSGRVSEIYFMSQAPLITSGTATAWTSFSLADYVPVNATHWWALAKLVFVSAGDTAAVGLCPSNPGSGIAANSATQTFRDISETAGGSTYFGAGWMPITSSQTCYYRLLHFAGTTTVTHITVAGARFVR